MSEWIRSVLGIDSMVDDVWSFGRWLRLRKIRKARAARNVTNKQRLANYRIVTRLGYDGNTRYVLQERLFWRIWTSAEYGVTGYDTMGLAINELNLRIARDKKADQFVSQVVYKV